MSKENFRYAECASGAENLARAVARSGDREAAWAPSDVEDDAVRAAGDADDIGIEMAVGKQGSLY